MTKIKVIFFMELPRIVVLMGVIAKLLYIHISPFLNKVDKRHGILAAKIVFIFNVFIDSIHNLII